MNFQNLIYTLLSEKPSFYISKNEEQLFKLIPELKACKGFNQNNEWHIYDVYNHTLSVIDNVSPNIYLRLAALFHDIGKPLSYTEDENGVGHFYGHWIKSKEIFDKFADKYKLDDYTKNIVSKLILYHDIRIPKLSEKEIDELLNIFEPNEIEMLFELKRADLLSQNSKYHYLLDDYIVQRDNLLKKYSNKEKKKYE